MRHKTTKKEDKKADDYPHDRITISVTKGLKPWLQSAAAYLNRDMSKVARESLEDWYKAHRHLLDDDLRKRWEEIRKRSGGTHWGDFL